MQTAESWVELRVDWRNPAQHDAGNGRLTVDTRDNPVVTAMG